MMPSQCSRSGYANRSGVVRKRVVVGEPSVDAHRRRSIEPGEECQFLHVVGKSVLRIEDRRRQRAAQRISCLQVPLTPRYLTDVAPQRRGIVAERIVHPLRYLVGHVGNVWHWTREYVAG